MPYRCAGLKSRGWCWVLCCGLLAVVSRGAAQTPAELADAWSVVEFRKPGGVPPGRSEPIQGSDRLFLVPAGEASRLAGTAVIRICPPVNVFAAERNRMEAKNLVDFGAYCFDPNNPPMELPPLFKSEETVPGGTDARSYIVQLENPLPPRESTEGRRIRTKLSELGVDLDARLRGSALLAYVPKDKEGELKELEGGVLRKAIPVPPAFKIDPNLPLGGVTWEAYALRWKKEPLNFSERRKLDVEVFVDVIGNPQAVKKRLPPSIQVLSRLEPLPANARTAERAMLPEAGGIERRQIKLRISTFGDLAALAKMPEVRSIAYSEQVKLRNATTSWVIQTGNLGDRRMFRHGLNGSGQTIGFLDTPFDPFHCFFADARDSTTFDKARKIVHYRRDAGIPDRTEVHAHGTEVAGILAGRDTFQPTDVRKGQAPEAKLTFHDLGDVIAPGVVQVSLEDALEQQYVDGARVFSNSWGHENLIEYSEEARTVDRFLYDHEDAVAVFATSNSGRVKTPEDSRNAIAVGASRQARLQDYAAGTEYEEGTWDGRRKPEVFAPGCRIETAEARTQCGVRRSPSTIETGHGRINCATSWAAPAVAGAAAIVRQYFKAGWHPTGIPYVPRAAARPWRDHRCRPTGALVKAMLLNGTRDMKNAPQKGTEYPSAAEGWGLLRLDDSLFIREVDADGKQKDLLRTLVADVRNKDGLKERDYETYHLEVDSTLCSEEQTARARCEETRFKVTLAWTDPPVEGKGPNVNDLDLVVYDGYGKKIYCGNFFTTSTGLSTPIPVTGGDNPLGLCRKKKKYDDRNNVEQIVLHPAGKNHYKVFVRAIGVHSSDRQGFALVASGELQGTGRYPTRNDCTSL